MPSYNSHLTGREVGLRHGRRLPVLVEVYDVLCDGVVIHFVHVVADDEQEIEARHDGS